MEQAFVPGGKWLGGLGGKTGKEGGAVHLKAALGQLTREGLAHLVDGSAINQDWAQLAVNSQRPLSHALRPSVATGDHPAFLADRRAILTATWEGSIPVGHATDDAPVGSLGHYVWRFTSQTS